MKFIEAVKAMKECKQVRRRCWDNNTFISKTHDFCYWNDGGANKRMVLSISNLEATDWEIYEEEDKELFDKEHNQYKGFNDYKEEGYEGFITLTKRDGSFQAITIIDTDDFSKVKHSRWVLNNNGYARGYDKEKRYVYLHQVIYGGVLEGNMIDHINKNRLDNRKENLREVNFKESILNRSIFKNNTSGETGVYYNKDDDKWVAKIMVDYKSKHLGTFDTKEEATKVRKEAEKKYFDSDWNLADYMNFGYEDLKNFKTFIQKVKEDVNKTLNRDLTQSKANEIIDKRAGRL